DFNLSTDWSPGPASPAGSSSRDPGGTLAYMAPERLRVIAEPELAPPPCPAARHRADLYALGLILREAITGVPPDVPPPDDSLRSGRSLAARLASERSSGDPCDRPRLASVPPGLRVILRRCLAPAPAERYANASQLAEDLDRWRAGRPLAHTRSPLLVNVGRWLRGHRKAFTAATLSVGIGGMCTVAAAHIHAGRSDLSDRALEKYIGLAHDLDFGARAFWSYDPRDSRGRPGNPSHAERLFTAYDLLDDTTSDFWNHEDLIRLKEPDASDARAWIIEQALVYGIEAARPENAPFREDRERAYKVLNRIRQDCRLSVLDGIARLLGSQLGLPGEPQHSPPERESPPWLEDYLEGVLAEVLRPQEAEAIGFDPSSIGHASAVTRYKAAISARPDLYWPWYRLGAISYRNGDFETADRSYARCLDRRPGDVAVLLGRGSCAFYLGRDEDAIRWYRRVVEKAPRWPVGWRDLALLGARTGRPELVEQGLARLNRAGTPDGRRAIRDLNGHLALAPDLKLNPFVQVAFADHPGFDLGDAPDELDELGTQGMLADEYLARGDLHEAIRLYNRILELEPGHLATRFNRAVTYQRQGEIAKATEDYRQFVADPNVELLIERKPTGLISFLVLSGEEALSGKPKEAIRLVEEASVMADRTGRYRGEVQYALARACVSAARQDPSMLTKAARALESARASHPGYIERRFYTDPALADHRAELAGLIGGVDF
ncbi:tetratricopeptide repeat protein, partial [Tautonia sociabilis]